MLSANSGRVSSARARCDSARDDNTDDRAATYRRFPSTNGPGEACSCSCASGGVQSVRRGLHGVIVILSSSIFVSIRPPRVVQPSRVLS